MKKLIAVLLATLLLVGCQSTTTVISDVSTDESVATSTVTAATTTTTTATTKKTTRKTTKKTTTVPPTTTTTVQRARQDFQIVVEGKNIMTPLTPAYIMDDSLTAPVVPFTAILRAVGAKIKWTSDTEATISIKGENYYLDTRENLLIEEKNPETPWLRVLWSGNSPKKVRFMENGEYMVDFTSVGEFFKYIGLDWYWKENGGKTEAVCFYWTKE